MRGKDAAEGTGTLRLRSYRFSAHDQHVAKQQLEPTISGRWPNTKEKETTK